MGNDKNGGYHTFKQEDLKRWEKGQEVLLLVDDEETMDKYTKKK